jgi:hypothetical protein
MPKLYAIGISLLFFTLLGFSLASGQNVGIGTAVPTQRLHVSGSLRIDGPLMPDNLPGLDGQALLSRGAGLSPRWGSATEGQRFTTVYSTGSAVIASGAWGFIPGLSQTFDVPATGSYDVYIYTDGAAQLNGGSTNQGSQLAIVIYVDGVMVRALTSIVDNTSNYVSGIRAFVSSFYTTLAPGTHTVEIWGYNFGPVALTAGTAYAPGAFLVSSLTVGLIKR